MCMLTKWCSIEFHESNCNFVFTNGGKPSLNHCQLAYLAIEKSGKGNVNQLSVAIGFSFQTVWLSTKQATRIFKPITEYCNAKQKQFRIAFATYS